MPTLTQTATPHTTGPLAKIQFNFFYIRLPALQVILFTVTRQILIVYKHIPRHANGALKVLYQVTNPAVLTSFFASLIILPTRI
jgi:hypothetical protein